GSLGEVARIVTGFTAAHSLTLALAVLGWVRPERAPIEALIGLSIALVATENVWLAGARGRALPAVVAGALAVLALVAAAGRGRARVAAPPGRDPPARWARGGGVGRGCGPGALLVRDPRLRLTS